MGLVEGMNKVFGLECDECSVPFPKSMLISFTCVGFNKYDGRYCPTCYQKIARNFKHCHDCGDEYPTEHLYISMSDKAVYCLRCLNKEDEDEI